MQVLLVGRQIFMLPKFNVVLSQFLKGGSGMLLVPRHVIRSDWFYLISPSVLWNYVTKTERRHYLPAIPVSSSSFWICYTHQSCSRRSNLSATPAGDSTESWSASVILSFSERFHVQQQLFIEVLLSFSPDHLWILCASLDKSFWNNCLHFCPFFCI